MKRGLVFGKFLPLHNGHIALINFAAARCDELIVLVCAEKNEPIPGQTRLGWVQASFSTQNNIRPVLLPYDGALLPNTSVASVEVSRVWAQYFEAVLPPIDVLFTSEPYGDYVASYLSCRHIPFDINRAMHPISSTAIRENVFHNLHYLPVAVRPFYVKKICLYGTESTGKSTLAERLATHYHTVFVPEMAREIIEKTEACTYEHLLRIAELQARSIEATIPLANRLLFVDTDINITRSYSRFLFQRELEVSAAAEKANRFDLYLYLDNDAPHIQDGTRLAEQDRNLLHDSHRLELKMRYIPYQLIKGNWEQRFSQCIEIIDALFPTP